jgi:hypothetical protein
MLDQDLRRRDDEIEYLPYDDRTQLARQIPAYPRSFTRTPAQPLIERPVTLSELTGPTSLERRMKICNGDLSRSVPDGPRAMGSSSQWKGG